MLIITVMIPLEEKYKKLVLELVDRLIPKRRPCKYSNAYYFDNFVHVLKNVVSWKSLSKVFPNMPKNHYKTIQDKFLQWSKANIFEIAYEKLIEETKKIYTEKSQIDLFIDTANINNKYGIEYATYGQNKKKKVTKISLVVNEEKIPLSVTFHKGNKHDSQTVTESLKKVTEGIKYKKINVIGDSAYILKPLVLKDFAEIKIRFIAPYRKNMKRKNSEFEVEKLSKRSKVEHSNAYMKDYNRVYVRRDRLIHTYRSFVFMALGIKFFADKSFY